MKPATVVTTYPSHVNLTCCGPHMPHQIRTGNRWRLGRHWVYVSCACRHIAGTAYEPLEERPDKVLFPAADMLAAYRAHLPRNGHTP